MIHTKFLGNCKHVIDWDRVILDCSKAKGEVRPLDSDKKGIDEIKSVWENNGYIPAQAGGSAEWIMHYPGHSFDLSVVDKFCEFYSIESYTSCWISEVRQGFCVPWHFDIMPVCENARRIHCHIGVPDPGHIFIIDNEHYLSQQQGNAFEWKNIKAWHSGVNIGTARKYLFNLY